MTADGPYPGSHPLSPLQVNLILPSISAMASGNDGDPPRAHGRRGSNGRRLSQELNSGKKGDVLFGAGAGSIFIQLWFSSLFVCFFFPAVFL